MVDTGNFSARLEYVSEAGDKLAGDFAMGGMSHRTMQLVVLAAVTVVVLMAFMWLAHFKHVGVWKLAVAGVVSVVLVAVVMEVWLSGHHKPEPEFHIKCDRDDCINLPGDPAEACAQVRREAVRGMRGAKYRLGMMLLHGGFCDPEPDTDEALTWLGQAALEDHPDAAKESKRLASRDARRKALVGARNGNARAIFNLALMLYSGGGGETDKAGAREWFRKAAEQGNAAAQFNLGVMLDKGEGGKEDKAGALKLFRKAAAQGQIAAEEY